MSELQIKKSIYNLNRIRTDLQQNIADMERKRERIECEYMRKIRQESQISDFYFQKRQQTCSIREAISGEAFTKILTRHEDIYSNINANNILTDVYSVQTYLKANCEKINQSIQEMKSKIAEIDKKINKYNIKLKQMEEL